MKSIKKYAVEFWHLMVGAGKEFSNDNALKLSASLSYYTIFSLAPMLLVIIAVCGIFFGRDAVQGEIYSRIDNWVGADAALQIQSMLKMTLDNSRIIVKKNAIEKIKINYK